MPLNVPTYDTNQFSFGPGLLFLGASGATPTEDVGAITEDGIAFEITSEKKVITQGNPKIPIYPFSQAQGLMVRVTGIEWDFDDVAKILGAGSTTSGGGSDTFAFGGEPLVTQLALRVRHVMAPSGHTMFANVWTCASEGGLSTAMNHDEHQFAHNYMALRSTTDWASNTLAYTDQLFQFSRQTA